MLAAGGPYPLVVLPVGGEYWLEGSNHSNIKGNNFKHLDCKIETNNVIQSYRRDFIGKVCFQILGCLIGLHPLQFCLTKKSEIEMLISFEFSFYWKLFIVLHCSSEVIVCLHFCD